MGQGDVGVGQGDIGVGQGDRGAGQGKQKPRDYWTVCCCHRYGFRQLIERRCTDILQPDITWMGGITEVGPPHILQTEGRGGEGRGGEGRGGATGVMVCAAFVL